MKNITIKCNKNILLSANQKYITKKIAMLSRNVVFINILYIFRHLANNNIKMRKFIQPTFLWTLKPRFHSDNFCDSCCHNGNYYRNYHHSRKRYLIKSEKIWWIMEKASHLARTMIMSNRSIWYTALASPTLKKKFFS